MAEETAAEQPQEPDAPPQQSAEPESSSQDSPESSASQTTPGVQKRIDQLVARISQSEARAAKAEAELEVLRKKDEVPEPEPPVRPKRSDYDDAEAFAEAVADWTDERLAFDTQQREAAEERKRKVAEDQKQQQSVTEKQQETLRWVYKGSDQISDFVNVVMSAPSCSQAMLDVAGSMENGHKVLYDLVQDEAEALRISKLDKYLVAIEMSKRSAKKETSKAPEPPTPVSGGGDTADNGDLRDDLPVDEWAKRFRARRAKRRRA